MSQHQQERRIIGIGEALLERLPHGDHPSGLAVEVALHAARLGHRGVAISRIGQDASGAQIRSTLLDAGVDVSALQSDPDLPTGRRTIRSIAGRVTAHLEERSAFDNLQWDFDLEDVAQSADAVVFGALARRVSQTRMSIDRFLDECRGALRIFDLSRGEETLDRAMTVRTLQHADGVILSRASLHALEPASRTEGDEGIASAVSRRHGLGFVVVVAPGGGLKAFSEQGAAMCDAQIEQEQLCAAVMGLLHGLLAGWDWPRALAAAARYATFAAENPGEAAPHTLFDAH